VVCRSGCHLVVPPLPPPHLPVAPHFYPTSSCSQWWFVGLQWSWSWVSFPSPHRLVVPPLVVSLPLCFPPPSRCCCLPLVVVSLPLVVWWCSSSSPSSFCSLTRHPPCWFIPTLIVPSCVMLPAPQSLAPCIYPVSSRSWQWWGVLVVVGSLGRSWVSVSWCFCR
jgi:hypothetical protein